MDEERVIYEEGEVKVTTARAIFGSKTYAMKNITSVEMSKKEASGCAPAALAIFGVIAVIYSASSFGNSAVTGIVGILFGALLLAGSWYSQKASRPDYIVKVSGSSGESNALTSRDQAQIQKIVGAINEAIVAK